MCRALQDAINIGVTPRSETNTFTTAHEVGTGFEITGSITLNDPDIRESRHNFLSAQVSS